MSVTLLSDRTGPVSELLRKAGLEAVKASCEAVKDDCEANVKIRTGSLQASFYTALHGQESGYHEAVADAEGKNPKVQVLPEVQPEAEGQGIVSAAAGHSVYQELGTIHNAPNPVMHQAADAERSKLPGRAAEAIAKVTRS